MSQPSSLATLFVAGALAWPLPAVAEAPSPAEALFDEGVAAMEAQRFDKACPAIEESYRLDPRPGTLFTLAECEAERGRLATAFARYDEYLTLFATLPPDKQARQREREKTSRAQKTALGPRIPLLILFLPPDAPSGTVIRRDGAELAREAIGLALPVDPGEHIVTTQAPLSPVTEVRVMIDKGERKPLMLQVRGAPVAAPVLATKALGRSAVAPPLPDLLSRQRVAAFVVGGLGLAGLTAGGVTGAVAIGEKSVILANCNGPACNATGKAATDHVKALGLASAFCITAGVVGMSAGAMLYLTEPARPTSVRARSYPWVGARVALAGPTSMTIDLHGRW